MEFKPPKPQRTFNSSKAYVALCDESSFDGKNYCDFYGGVLVRLDEFPVLEGFIKSKKDDLNLLGEVKWQKVSQSYLSKYKELMHSFFTHVRNGSIRGRIMFRKKQADHKRWNASRDERYFKLYYQFIKHGFGFAHRPVTEGGYSLVPLFDQLPHTKDSCTKFKKFIASLQNVTPLKESGLRINPSHIREIRSHDYHLLQCLDIVLGSMCHYLNETGSGSESTRRGQAKMELHEYIVKEIRKSHAFFQCHLTTPRNPWPIASWENQYRHWLFESQ